MKVYEAVAESLLAHGVSTVYALMTSDTMSMLGLLKSKGIDIVRARTEYGAVCMADGHARETGELGVVALGAGPSAAMVGTSLVTALRRRSPLVVIAADAPSTQRHHLKRFEQHRFFELCAGHCLSMVRTDTVVQDTFEVLRRARSGQGPAVLNVPVDLLEGDVEFRVVEADWRFLSPAVEVEAPRPAPAAIRAAVDALAAARRPLVIVGRGVDITTCREILLDIGDRVGALYGSSLQGQYFFDSPYDVGVVGTVGLSSAARAMTEADCALVVGAALNAYTSGHGQFLSSARIIHIDSRREVFGASIPVDVAICADAASALGAIRDGLAVAGVTSRPGFRDAQTVSAIAEDFAALTTYRSDTPALDPRFALDVIGRGLPSPRRLVLDAGHFAFFAVDHLRCASPRERVWTGDFASIGLGVPVGIGVAKAAAGCPTVVVVGDGGFAMSLPELDTAVRHRLPITFVVIDDEAYGAEVRYLENRHEPDELARFDSPDFVAIAQGYGCDAVLVRTPAEVEAVARRIGRSDRPLVVQIKVDPTVANRVFKGRTRSAAAAD